MNLIIVESPGKIKKIEAYAGSGFQVEACFGHIRDLPKGDGDLGVGPPDFRPRYVPTDRGKGAIAKLKALAKTAEQVYLATDPDREGEGIAWHLAEVLGLKNPLRISFNEITESAVKAAINNPRAIDQNLVYAQEGRRVLDRLFGFQVSTLVSSRLRRFGLSAGRVQSPALRLVVERERDINAFKVTGHFGVEIEFEAVENVKDGWKAHWNPKHGGWLEGDQEFFLDQAASEKIAALKSWTVASGQESESRQAPPAPFTTSSLQQAASNALKLDPKRTMELVQALYENSHITYMRTDSPNLSDEAIAEIRSLAAQNDWPVPAKPRKWASKDGAQEAHEAIRPTVFSAEEAGGNAEEKALYKLIRTRALASQLTEAVYSGLSVTLESELDGKKVVCEARGRTLVSPGWRVILSDGDQAAEPDEDVESNPIPKLREGSQPVVISGRVVNKKTRPPARFTQAALIKKLEDLGIGRPSTYASTMEHLVGKGYVKNDQRRLAPTPLGEQIIAALEGHFEFLDYGFTKDLEARLDEIAEGQADYQWVVGAANGLLDKEMAAFLQKFGLACPDCGRPLFYSEKSQSWLCPGYKSGACSSRFYDDNGQPGPKKERKEPPPLTDFKCSKCGRPLVRLTGAGAKGAYDFYKCSAPDCRQTLSALENGAPDYDGAKKKGAPRKGQK
jgi:DNA topoisomerase-1